MQVDGIMPVECCIPHQKRIWLPFCVGCGDDYARITKETVKPHDLYYGFITALQSQFRNGTIHSFLISNMLVTMAFCLAGCCLLNRNPLAAGRK